MTYMRYKEEKKALEKEIKKNSSIVHLNRPNKRIFELSWRDPDFDSSKATYCYIRTIQANNEEAISSPIWVN